MSRRAPGPVDGPELVSATLVVRVCLHPRHRLSVSPLFSLHPGASRCGYLVTSCRFLVRFGDDLSEVIATLNLWLSTTTVKCPGARFRGISQFTECRKKAGGPAPTSEPRWAPAGRCQPVKRG